MLPIQAVTDALCEAIATDDVILKAPPGAGKSTYLPLVLLQHRSFAKQRIILLQPRRVAVKTIAHYLASQLGEKVGQQVGYRIKGETKVSTHTRLEVVTEGVLVRLLQADPELNGIGLVIFDEFHERSLAADFSLALCCDVRQGLRDDLRLLVMSATLDGTDLVSLLPKASVIESQGRQFPIELYYQGTTETVQMVFAIRRLLIELTSQKKGNILVFLPSQRLIKQLASELSGLGSDWLICPLYGELSLTEQQKAIAAPEHGNKIVISTNIAETSLTIEGISTVVDSGLVNHADFHLRSGHYQLSLQATSQSASTQRSGRAGRLGPGSCYRMWSQDSHHRRKQQTPPAIHTEDVTDILLQSLTWGCELSELPLLDQPSAPQLSFAYQQLVAYGAVEQCYKLTPKGRQLAVMGTSLPMANMLYHAQQQSSRALSAACTIVALLENGGKQLPVDVTDAAVQLQQHRQGTIWQQVLEWHKRLQCQWQQCEDTELLAALLLNAFPNRVAYQLSQGRYQLATGGIVTVDDDRLTSHQWLVVAEIFSHQKRKVDLVTLAAPVPLSLLQQHCPAGFYEKRVCDWQDDAIRVSLHKCYGRVIYQRSAIGFDKASDEEKLLLWQKVINDRGLSAFNWSDSCDSLLQRLDIMKQLMPDLDTPRVSETSLIESWRDWLAPSLLTIKKRSQLTTINLFELIQQQLDWSLRQQLESLLPDYFVAPTGTKAPIRYEQNKAIVSVRIQEVFGTDQHPMLAKGRLPLTFELLSPARRPIQLTADLPAFWTGSYQQVKKEMRGRYIRHFWPDDPANSVATNRTKNKMTK